MNRILDVNTTVAFLTPKHSWVLGKVSAYDIKVKMYTCVATEPEPMTITGIKADQKYIWAPRVEYLEEDVSDLLQLTELHEASLLFCLKRRYFKDIVYTNIGPIVVAINPFNYTIPWYMDAKMVDYISEGVEIERNLPHSWAVAHNTYWEMKENKCNQTILISGESGAGKTEAAKIVVKYLGNVSTVNGTSQQRDVCGLVSKKVNAASPILEAFGNAKTVRNDNSSRFGKFAKIQFDRDGFLIGSFTIKYLLEKSRIITAAKDERVYHSFYQLAQGEDAKEYNIRNPKLHKMLSTGNCIQISGVDDGADFMATKQAFTDVGIGTTEQRAVWLIVAGILFFQNLDFVETEEKSGMTAVIDPSLEQVLARTCELWGMDTEGMQKEMLTTTLSARGETTVKVLTKVQAVDTRDSVSKGLYDWLFDWLVKQININVSAADTCEQWIGLLDIFGFENFASNSFEQLCINLANETLQQHYNHHIFTADIKECHEEGIDTTDVKFVDNKECIDLLVGKTGIFTMLDDECMVNGTDKNLLSKINGVFLTTKTNAGHPFFGPVTGRAMDSDFRILHYAADVQYTVDGFVDKNRDTMKDGMKKILAASTVPLISSLIPAIMEGRGNKITVGLFFRKQLHELMEVINSTNPHWIRCIKPHPAKQARMFSHLEVMTQLRSAGVLDTVKIRKAGYPIRFKIDLFLVRYRILITPELEKAEKSVICRGILKNLDINKEIGQLGKTKLFFRREGFTRMNHAKDEATMVYALMLQRIGKACLERHELFMQYVIRHREKIMEERRKREEALKKQREEEEKQRKGEEEENARQIKLQEEKRGKAVIIIQKLVRGFLSRIYFAHTYIANCRAHEEKRLDDLFQRFRSNFEEVERRVRVVENKHLMNECHNEIAIHGQKNRRKEIANLYNSRIKAIEDNEEQRRIMLEQEVKNDIDQEKRNRKERQRQELEDYERNQQEIKAKRIAIRDKNEKKEGDKIHEIFRNYNISELNENNHRKEIEKRYMKVKHSSGAPTERRNGGHSVIMSPRRIANEEASNTDKYVLFAKLKKNYAEEEEWMESRTVQSRPAIYTDPSYPLDQKYEDKFRRRVLQDSHNSIVAARILRGSSVGSQASNDKVYVKRDR